MKKILFLAFIIMMMKANAQITLEHTYDNASTTNSSNNCVGKVNQLLIIHFEVSGDRYVKINRCEKVISIYNMNHSLVKNIPLAGIPESVIYESLGDVLYLSEHLFNNDAKIEFMYMYESIDTAGNLFYITNIYNEDKTLLFSENGGPIVKLNIPMQQYPIYNTSAGTKMILSYQDGTAKVFSLPGNLTTAIQENTTELLKESNLLSNPSPNPTSSNTRIGYQLPKDINQGEVVFYNIQGSEVKRFLVDRTFDYLSVSTTDIPAGIYYYRLETNSQNTEGKKLVVIK